MLNLNKIAITKLNKVMVVDTTNRKIETKNNQLIASINRNIENFGYTFSNNVVKKLKKLTSEELVEFHDSLIGTLREILEAPKFKVFYDNFPKQVMEMSQTELYLNALVH